MLRGPAPRGAARTGGDDSLVDTVVDPLVDERGAERRLNIRRAHVADRRYGGHAPSHLIAAIRPSVEMMDRTISIEVFSDVVCPWCYIGKRRLDRALASLADDPEFPAGDVVFRPFQLDPHAPRG